jgi:carbon storage regulator
MVGNEVRITIVDVRGETVQIGIDAPRKIAIYREEIYQAIQAANQEAAQRADDGLDELGRPKPPGDSQSGN